VLSSNVLYMEMLCLIVWSQVTVASHRVATPRCRRSLLPPLTIDTWEERERDSNAGGKGRKDEAENV
jgi:hypothetical protein